MKIFKNLVVVFFITLAFALTSTKTLAAENSNFIVSDLKTDDTNFSRKESVIDFMNRHPEYKDDVMKILNDKGALNTDGSIKDDLGILDNRSASPVALFTGYEYTFAGTLPADFYPQEIIARYTNNTSTAKNFSVTQSYTVSTSYSVETSIGAKASLEKVYELNAGVKLAYTYTQSASTQYGTQVSVPAYTTGTLKASAIKQCYSFREQYYVLGVAVGNDNIIGVFKPTGVHWYYNESKN